MIQCMFIGLSVAVVVIALPCYRQHRAIGRIKALGGEVHTISGGPEWIRRYVGKNSMQIFDRVSGVSFNATAITDADLVHLDDLKDVEALWLSQTGVTNAGLIHLRGMRALKALNLNFTDTGTGLTHLSGLTNLEVLHLSSTGVTDADLAVLRGLTNLKGLSLARTTITDAGLVHLNGMTKLQWLSLRGTRVTAMGVDSLQRALPGCQIDWKSVLLKD